MEMNEDVKAKVRILAVLKAGKTREQTAEICGVSLYMVTQAVKWGEGSGLFDKDKAVLLERRIAEVMTHAERIEDIFGREYKRLKRLYDRSDNEESEADGKLPFRIRDSFVPLAQELRENQVLIMELQGLYKQTVQMQVTNNNTNILVLPNKASGDDWDEMVRAVMTKGADEYVMAEKNFPVATLLDGIKGAVTVEEEDE